MVGWTLKRLGAQWPAFLAALVVLGGTSVAAAAGLPANSVGTKQLRKGAVTGTKVAPHTLTGANINLAKLGTVRNAARLAGVLPSGWQRLVSGNCLGKGAITQVKANGTVACQSTGAGTITGVSAGTGLSGGGSSGNVSLAIAPDYQLPQGCSTNQLAQWTGTAWGCAANPASTAWQLTGNAGTDPVLDYVGTSDNQPLNLDANGQRALQLQPESTSPNLIGGWMGNSVTSGAVGAVIGGGGASAQANTVSATFGVVGGGTDNTASGYTATVPGGVGNTASGNYSLAAGENDTANGVNSTVLGDNNTAHGSASAAFGLDNSTGSAGEAATALGIANTAGGEASAVLGQNATDGSQANAFVWSDGTQGASNQDFAATSSDEFDALASNGFRFQLSAPGATFNGCTLTSGSAGWQCTSDRNAKHLFRPISDQAILGALERTPIASWSYRLDRSNTRHIGPTAQDFMKAFRVGNNPRAIGTLDEGGVALAGVQGLDRLVQRQQHEIQQLDARLAALEHHNRS
jgi:hypothetical protein